eukprot:TRINITY_DN1141_c0_g1_i1.p1 TRINITY_DN1141_c0_g1~~TRINITY_DN1141_c0_g1_i1.p1  ORF type:complete len:144 (-),score=41.41 TRINITY_DN1141_c0_g1_i1:103-534(-)
MATDEEIAECFDVFDKDKDKKITAEELGTVIRALGKCPLQSEVAAFVKEAGGENALIDLRSFKDFYNKTKRKPSDLERDMREAFKALDKEGNGLISEAELRQILMNLGEALEPYEVDSLLRSVDVGSDGEIRFDTFVDLLLTP